MAHTLLLADDSLTIQRVIELTFADEDIRVVAVSDGSQAIAALERERPDIVLADIGMPGQNGYDVARFVRDTPSLAGIPVVLLTGAFDPVDQSKVDEVGCDAVLAKPFEPQMVIARVKELLNRGATARASATAAAPAVAPPPATPPSNPVAQETVETVEPEREVIATYFDQLDVALTSEPAPSSPAPAKTEPSTSSAPFPPLAEAFATLTAPLAQVSAEAKPAAGPVTPTLTPELIDQVTRRVLEQMSDRVLRQTVTDIVTKVAERLVREEIERIKTAIPK